MTNPPDTIYLQLIDGDIDGATWCQDKQQADDVEYIRLDLLAADSELYQRVCGILQRVAGEGEGVAE